MHAANFFRGLRPSCCCAKLVSLLRREGAACGFAEASRSTDNDENEPPSFSTHVSLTVNAGN